MFYFCKKFKNIVDFLQRKNKEKARKIEILREKAKPKENIEISMMKFENLAKKFKAKTEEIEKSSQMTREYEEIIRNLEFSIVKIVKKL